LHLEDEHRVFFLKATESTCEHFYTEDVEEDSNENKNKPLMKPFQLLHPGQSTEFGVLFKPTLAQRLEGKIRVLVADAYSDKTLIELVGEGCTDEFTLSGLEEDTQESLKEDIIQAVRANHIEFGACPIGKRCSRTFTITNNTRWSIMRFEWEAHAPFQFSPKVGHLLPGCVKNITVTLKSDVPVTFRRHLVKCKVTKINFELPGQRKVPDWDDQTCTVTHEKSTRKDLASMWPEIEKVVKTVPEPAHTVVKESGQEVNVYLSALVAYAQFKLSTTVVQVEDTVPSQTATATFTMENTGKIALEYSWIEDADREDMKKRYSTTLMC
ncbi:HYDIN protein, partial [Sitta europaea]|nr:HYDIN protein [Sitta europaea]